MEDGKTDHCCSCVLHNYCVSWNSNKKTGCSDRKWRRIQVARFLAEYPEFSRKPSIVLKWINYHKPNPQPHCTKNALQKSIKKLRSMYTIESSLAQQDELSVFPKQNYSNTIKVSASKQRRIQLSRYLKHFPSAKPKDVFQQLAQHNPNPWPEARSSNMSLTLNRLKLRASANSSASLMWAGPCPKGTDSMSWRKQQISRYLEKYPDHGASKVIMQLRSLSPNPWPEVSMTSMWRFINDWRVQFAHKMEALERRLTLQHAVGEYNIEPRVIKFDTLKPPGYTAAKQRRYQLALYIEEFPFHGPSKVKEQLQSSSPNPQPDVTLNLLQKAMQKARSFLLYRSEARMFSLSITHKTALLSVNLGKFLETNVTPQKAPHKYQPFLFLLGTVAKAYCLTSYKDILCRDFLP